MRWLITAAAYPIWLPHPDTVASGGLVLSAWWAGKLRRTVDCDREIETVRSEEKAKAEALVAKFREQVLGCQERAKALEVRAVRAEQSAEEWRDAYQQESVARQNIETVARNAMESGQITMKLAEVLTRSLGGK